MQEDRIEKIKLLEAHLESSRAEGLEARYERLSQIHLLMVYLTQGKSERELNDKEACRELDRYAMMFIEEGTRFVNESNNQVHRVKIAKQLKEAYQVMGRRDFEKFLIAIEWNFPMEMKFYDIRWMVLREWVIELQRLEDGTYKGLSISAPPRTGKTGLGTMFFMWCMLRHPDRSCFFVTHTAAMASKVYNDIINMLEDGKREITSIFPNGYIVQKNAEQNFIRLKSDSSNPYHTAYFRGIDGNMARSIRGIVVVIL